MSSEKHAETKWSVHLVASLVYKTSNCKDRNWLSGWLDSTLRQTLQSGNCCKEDGPLGKESEAILLSHEALLCWIMCKFLTNQMNNSDLMDSRRQPLPSSQFQNRSLTLRWAISQYCLHSCLMRRKSWPSSKAM